MLEGHGDDLYRYGAGIKINFSSNVRPGGTPAGLKEAMAARFEECARYPDPGAYQLARKIADHHGLDRSSVMVTAGSVEAIYLLASAFRRTKATIAIPTFSEYADACRMHEIEVRTIHWTETADLDAALLEQLKRLKQRDEVEFHPDLFFLCNPNNPTGDLLSLKGLRDLLEAAPDILFIVDEAYRDFIPDVESTIPLLGGYRNLLLLRSLTKGFAIPGLRLGYMIGSSNLLERLCERRTPWSVSVPALIAGEHILDHFEELRLNPAPLLAAKTMLSRDIGCLSGYFPRPSQTHYFLVRTDRGRAADLKAHLATREGILIRDASNFAGLGEGWFRVAARDEIENRALVQALAGWRG